jgi:proteasome lid subunit RPN8/RPN11
MTSPLIRLQSPDAPEPLTEEIPSKISRRWWTDIEDGIQTPPISVFITQKAYIKANVHAGSDLENEVGGWLVGRWRADPDTGEHFIIIEAILPARHTKQGSAFLTFTQDSQLAMFDEMEDRFPESELVGWYHTHPRMGVFLSKYDLFLHKNFFTNPYQVALVIEPHTQTAGFFIPSADGSLDSRQYYGFNEIHNSSDRSVVHWKNVYTDPEPSIQEEES